MVQLPAQARRVLRRLRGAYLAERQAFGRSRPVRPHQVLYESFAGNGVLCNPEAIFRHLLADPGFAHLHHVWAISDPAAIARFQAEFARHPRVSYVVRGSGAYDRATATSGYLINNATFPPTFGKRPGQIYLNTWHGTPLKLMGLDMPDGAYESANTMRNLLSADYLLAANPFMAETMYEDAYRLRNVYPGRIIEEGYPRIDRQSVTSDEDAAYRRELRSAGVALGDEPFVLFAPTWKGTSFGHPSDDLDALATQVADLQTAVGADIRVLLKTHQTVHRFAASRPALAKVLVPNTIPTNVLLGMAAGLVTDYSSIFFDYLATGRPIAFLTPDVDQYATDRGTYVSVDELPGPVGPEARVIGSALRALIDDPEHPHERYRDWAERFVPFDDGGATARVVDIVFRGRTDGHRVRRTGSDDRTRILLYLGGMRSNGITSSALNLLHAIDPAVYDVTALMPLYRNDQARAGQVLIPGHVRQLFRMGGMNGSKVVHLRRRTDDWRGAPQEPGAARWHENLWRDEWTRVLGDASFDWVADFSGYSGFWANLMAHAPDAGKAIWLHNEMASDRDREVAGRRYLRRNLGLVFELYSAFDQLVSVSEQLTELNRVELGDYASADRFMTVRNLPNVERVAEGAAAPLDSVLDEGEPQPAWLTGLEDDTLRWFVSVGRLSPEKNHARLLRSFASVHARHPEARLLIVGGGPLEDDLRAQIEGSGLADAAYLAGLRANPFVLMAAADCFVLSSVYEGQPMVLLEAALCELPIVSTAFGSVRGALPTDTIHVVEQDDDALAEGMIAFLNGEVPPSRLDVAGYMRAVMDELDAVVAARPR